MKRFSSFLWAGAAGVFLSACAYTPLYAPKHQAHVMVGAVTVSNPDILPGERRTAQDVSRELKQRFPSLDPNGYSLRVSLFEDLGTLAVQRSATVARAEVVLTATFTLTDAAGTDVLMRTWSLGRLITLKRRLLARNLAGDMPA